MNLETRARLATDETLGLARDVAGGLTALRRTRRRRAAAKAIAVSVAVVVALSGVLVVRQHERTPRPVGTVRNGSVLSLTLSGVVVHPGSPAPQGLPAQADASGPFSVTPDGSQLFFSWQGAVRAADLRTGEQTELGRCPDEACVAAVSPDGTTLAFSRPHSLVLHGLGTGAVRRIDLGRRNAFGPVWAPDNRRIAFVSVETKKLASLVVVDTRTGASQVLAQLGESVGEQPAWSRDGSTLAYIRHTARPGRESTLALMTVPADGGPTTEVH